MAEWDVSSPLLTVEEALERILASVRPLPVQTVPLRDAVGLALAEDVTCLTPLPPFDNSAMDGYAVRAADTAAEPVSLRVTGVSSAGSAGAPDVGPGEAVRIFTGAPMPLGADAVVIQEVTRRQGDTVIIEEAAVPGRFVRKAGRDLPAGAVALESGRVLTPAAIALAAATGATAVRACQRPRVAVLSTGDELAAAGKTLAPGHIHDANLPMLTALLEQAGCKVPAQIHAPDDPAALKDALDTASQCDAIVSSGGVSVGDHDLVKDVLGGAGEIGFWRVAIRPGKPLAFGAYRGTPFFGLPGNPVSAFVTFRIFVLPALRRMMGYPVATTAPVEVALDEPFTHDTGRREYVRAVVEWRDGAYHARDAGDQDSAALAALARANALVIVPEDVSTLSAGSRATALLLD